MAQRRRLRHYRRRTKHLARDVELDLGITPVEHLQFNGMARALARMIKRDHVPVSCLLNARTVIDMLPIWYELYHTAHPHKALGILSPREFIAARQAP